MNNEMKTAINKLLEELTLEEKIQMIHGAGLFRTGGVERLNIPPLKVSDGPMGVRAEFENAHWIPLKTPVDLVTYCPSNSAIAMTWNREYAKESGRVLGEETRGRGKDMILAPGINIKRVPLCGRNFEYFSEDPYLIQELAVPLIEGIESCDVAAAVKHFALNNQETMRLWVNVEVCDRALREIYLKAFETVVKKAKVKAIMGAYNLFRGEHCCQSNRLLNDILRKEWKYDGVVISDWGGVHDTDQAAKSALDIEMNVTPEFDDYFMANPLLHAVKNGEIEEAFVDEKVEHILTLMFRLNMIEPAGAAHPEQIVVRKEDRKKGCYNTPEHRSQVLNVARESIVLLKNDNQRLPLQEKETKKLLVIGQNAAVCHALGGGSAEIKALYEKPPLLGITEFLGGNCEVTYVKGYEVKERKEEDHNWQEDSLKDQSQKVEQGQEQESEESKRLREEALNYASQYDQVIYIGGLNHQQDVEGFDRKDLTLPYGQDRLIRELLEVNENMVVVMMAGSPVSMKTWIDKAKAVVFMGYCGMEGGQALAEILFGAVNPSGKLAETMPYDFADVGMNDCEMYPGRELTEEEGWMNARSTQEYKEGVFVGYRYYDKYNIPVQYAFGHGLSYTSFAYEGLVLKQSWQQEEKVVLSVDITNTGSRTGKEIVQLYLGEKEPSKENPVKELKGFEKIELNPKETKTVEFVLDKDAFSHYVEEKQCWEMSKGSYTIYIGSSLVDLRQQIDINI